MKTAIDLHVTLPPSAVRNGDFWPVTSVLIPLTGSFVNFITSNAYTTDFDTVSTVSDRRSISWVVPLSTLVLLRVAWKKGSSVVEQIWEKLLKLQFIPADLRLWRVPPGKKKKSCCRTQCFLNLFNHGTPFPIEHLSICSKAAAFGVLVLEVRGHWAYSKKTQLYMFHYIKCLQAS